MSNLLFRRIVFNPTANSLLQKSKGVFLNDWVKILK